LRFRHALRPSASPRMEARTLWRDRLGLHEAPKGFIRCQPTPLHRARPKTRSREAGEDLYAVRRLHTWRPNSWGPRLTAVPSRRPPHRAIPRMQAPSKRLVSQATESEPVVSTDLTQPITESTSSCMSLITSQLASSEESASQPSPASLNGR
jgi:hypothetical protein